MVEKSRFKRFVRRYAEERGISYTAALRELRLRGGSGRPPDAPGLPRGDRGGEPVWSPIDVEDTLAELMLELPADLPAVEGPYIAEVVPVSGFWAEPDDEDEDENGVSQSWEMSVSRVRVGGWLTGHEAQQIVADGLAVPAYHATAVDPDAEEEQVEFEAWFHIESTQQVAFLSGERHGQGWTHEWEQASADMDDHPWKEGR